MPMPTEDVGRDPDVAPERCRTAAGGLGRPASPQFAWRLLVSMRNTNTIAVIDPRAKRVKWQLSGLFVYSARCRLPAQRPLDGLRQSGWRSGMRWLADPGDRSYPGAAWRYDGCGEKPFFSLTPRRPNRLANGNVLTVEPHAGRVLEVTGDAQPRLDFWDTTRFNRRRGRAAGRAGDPCRAIDARTCRS